MNKIADDLNQTIQESNPYIYDMLSNIGRELFFPKGILSQSAEAKEKAHKINATIGIAKENNSVMSLSSITQSIIGIDPDKYLPYASSFGLPELRTKWKEELFRKNSSLKGKHISLPVATCGITHAVSIFSDLWTNPGDTVILPDMMWGNYNMTFGVRKGVKVIQYDTFDPELTSYNLDSFEKMVRKEAQSSDKIILILNFPHNPTGYSLSIEEGKKIADILKDIAQKGTNVIAVCDDAYFGLFYEQETMKESLFSLLSGSDERILAVKLDGATKEDYVWGLRIGFITYGLLAQKNSEDIYEALEKKTAGCVRGNVSNISHLSQAILLKSMGSNDYLEKKQEKFDLLMERCSEIKEILEDPAYKDSFDAYPFNSGYFMCIRLKENNAEKLRIHLLDKYGLGLISIGENNLRVAFSCVEVKDLRTLFDLIVKGVNDLRA
ncbi:MAG: aminotransferase class I/II-fold pyridoxal phosphate-dependent enzyme [Desulfobacteraceae bacterium]|nr:aminotransferase class I/II-fold pyridoxal phosphate-dependent enzyme [Desulfobacteraceae bacterium]